MDILKQVEDELLQVIVIQNKHFDIPSKPIAAQSPSKCYKI